MRDNIIFMSPEEILKKLIEGKQSSKDSQLLGAASLVTANRAKELSDASVLLARTTQESAELLAKTTLESAEQVRKSSEVSVRQMKILTIVLVVIGLLQTFIATAAMLVSMRVR
jgi:hypothetical protein